MKYNSDCAFETNMLPYACEHSLDGKLYVRGLEKFVAWADSGL